MQWHFGWTAPCFTPLSSSAGQYGIPKPWYFPFTRSYWCGTAAISDLGTEAQAHPEDQKGTSNVKQTSLESLTRFSACGW